MMWCLYAILILHLVLMTRAEDLNIHIPLSRRGGRFARHQDVNLTQLQDILTSVESRYAGTHRIVENNRLSRRWVPSDDLLDEDTLLKQTEHRGPWYAEI